MTEKELHDQGIRGIIFDCDGTLADTMPPHFISWEATLRRHGLVLDEDRFYALGGWPSLKIIELLAQEQSILVNASEVAEEKESLFETILQQVTAIEPVIDIAKKFYGTVPLAVATGGTRRICEQILLHIGATNLFDAVVTADDMARHKPNPDIFLEAARRINVKPEDCIVYEDTDPGIEAATRARMRWIDVRTFYRPRRITEPKNTATN
jgi:beta-phosphoglucomutase family hydrolase